MRFPPSFLEDIRARLPVSQVVRRRVQLKKQGREWRGLSPFTSEKTPSFYVNDQKMRWFDFSSGKNGNIFDFLMETEGLSFPESVERLAGEAGLALPVLSPEAMEREEKRADARQVLEAAAQFFQARLQAPEGARARGYLSGRGMSAEAQREFAIGYAPRERHALRDHLADRGFSLELMIEAGLLVHGEDIPVAYDRFRDRVMFPIEDRGGAIIAFGGRALEKDAPAKYLNSPETSLFHKGANLYSQHRARRAAHDSGRVIAVEGYIDVVSMYGAGFRETVAGLGTALTPEQCEALWRMAEEPILCFDGDKAGRKAAFRAVETALGLIGPGRSLRFAFLPEGQDPDDLVRAAGAGAMATILEAARPLVDVLWTREAEAQPLDTPERRAAFERRAFDALGAIPDETLRRHYRDEFATRMAGLFGRRPDGAPERRPYARGGRPGGPGPRRPGPGMISPALARSSLFAGATGAPPARESFILLILLRHPPLFEARLEEIAALDFGTAELRRLRDRAIAALGEGAEDLWGELAREGFGVALERLEKAVAPNWCAGSDASELDAGPALRQALALHHRAGALNREKREVEAALAEAGDEADFDALFARLRDIQAQMAARDEAEAAIEGFGAASGRDT